MVSKFLQSKWNVMLFLFLCLFNSAFQPAVANGNIGCLYADTLCVPTEEWCHDDYSFGKCLPQFGFGQDDLYREPLNAEQSGLLATLLEDLQGAGLGWEHPFVQCRMQGVLYSIRHKTPMPASLCSNLVPDPEILAPQSPLAFVRFTPPDDDFAEEVYYPTEDKRNFKDESLWNNFQEHKPMGYMSNIENEIQEGDEVTLKSRFGIPENKIDIGRLLSEYTKENQQPIESPIEELMSRQDEIKTREEKEHPHTSFRQIARERHIPLESSYYQPADDEERDPFSAQRNIYVDSNDNHQLDESTFNANPQNSVDSGGVYTEGGLVYVMDNADPKGDKARALLDNFIGFQRHERLDVKKPGPPASPSQSNSPNETPTLTKEVLPEHFRDEDTKKIKKVLNSHHSEDDDHAPHSVDTEYTHVILKNPIDSWTSGIRIVNAISEKLKLNLSHTRVDRSEVSFRVEPNPEKKTASDVAKLINDPRFKTNLSRRFGFTVIRAGVGDKTKEYDTAVQTHKIDELQDGPDATHVMVYMFAGAGAAAIIVIVVTLLLIKKHDRKRNKLGGLQTESGGNESCTKDYQELCRARMAVKGSNDSASGRIASLSKDGERPPSSRSSTSSWSEEPALTNMDISTGHMVLSYMEDHLKNKGRLQREWVALCRYEADPSAREAANQPQCEILNRKDAPLPYDHSRVVLNHLANAEGMDYINASTITDHDPRAPAYVAAQGPLPTTIAHFWQMIWEQGAVVIVALCRLQENGETICARYWPEEGSELYHIYEVHLVSEHIWCDDYLVRSFYLKNVRTSETRTVTQFHFLSWPIDGVPSTAKALLEFRRKVNKSYRGRSCPIVVHSSNGAGRTGAYILLDLVLARMNKGAREIDIAATLEHLRDQRAALVATRQQFEFVLMAVAEEVHAILKALPANTQNEKRDMEKEPIKEKKEDDSPKANVTKANEK